MRQFLRILALSSLCFSAAALAMGTPPPAPAPSPSAAPTNTTAVKAANAQAAQTNALIDQVSKAQADKDWETAEKVLKQLVAMDPKRSDFAQNLADAQYNQGEYAEAAKSYGIAIALASAPDADPAAKQALGTMYTNQGNSYLKLKKTTEGVAAFGKAAALSDNPGVAYFNICATLYNQGEDEGALTACDKSIEADQTRADAYFIKGIILADRGETDAKGNFSVPKGTTEALRAYLRLAPNGPHAAEVKQRLQLIDGKGP